MTKTNEVAAKLYNYQRGQAVIEAVKLLPKKPTMLLHSCCAPCNTAVIEQLFPYFDVTIYYNNHNIYPETEFNLRLSELQRFIGIFNETHQTQIKVIYPTIEMDQFTQKLAHRADDREGSLRCDLCMSLRLKECLDFAQQEGFEYVTTVMTMSRCKNSVRINELAQSLMRGYPNVTYMYSDFKKKAGIQRANELCNLYDIYRQEYCGCLYSFREYLKRKDKQ